MDLYSKHWIRKRKPFFSLSPFLQGLLVHSTFVMHNTSKQLTVQAVINDPKQLQALTFAIRSFQPISCTYHLSVTLDHNIIHISITYGAGALYVNLLSLVIELFRLLIYALIIVSCTPSSSLQIIQWDFS